MVTSEIVFTALALRKGEVDALAAVRRISQLRLKTENPDDEVFMIFRAIESDTDRFPVGEARHSCSVDYLRRMDAELAAYLKDVMPDLLNSCDELIGRFGTK